jgi:hypothetical protein
MTREEVSVNEGGWVDKKNEKGSSFFPGEGGFIKRHARPSRTLVKKTTTPLFLGPSQFQPHPNVCKDTSPHFHDTFTTTFTTLASHCLRRISQ